MKTILQPDLFGGESVVISAVPHGIYARYKGKTAYRIGTRDRNCATCRYGFLVERPRSYRRYRKCAKMGDSSSTATDVSRKMVCNNWEKTEVDNGHS